MYNVGACSRYNLLFVEQSPSYIPSNHSTLSALGVEGLASYKSVAFRGALVGYTPAKLAVNMFRKIEHILGRGVGYILSTINGAVQGAPGNYISREWLIATGKRYFLEIGEKGGSPVSKKEILSELNIKKKKFVDVVITI